MAKNNSEVSYDLDWVLLHVCQMVKVASAETTEGDSALHQWPYPPAGWQKSNRESENAQLLSQASLFHKFATFLLSKASYMARTRVSVEVH